MAAEQVASEEKSTLRAEVRGDSGKGVARKLRAKGLLPGVVYGSDVESVPLRIDQEELEEVLEGPRGVNTVFELTLDDGTSHELVILRDYQVDPIRRDLIHVDLMVVSPDQEIVVTVPIKPVGRSLGEREGGKLRLIHPEVPVRCTPVTIPTSIEMDVTELGPGGAISASELAFPDGVEGDFKVDYAVARILMPRQNVIGLEPVGAAEEEEEEEEGVEGEEGAEGEEEGVPTGAEAPGAE